MSSPPVAGSDADLLESAAILHDVGYAPDIAHTGFHPLDGAEFVHTIDAPSRLVNLVAHRRACRRRTDRRLSSGSLSFARADLGTTPPEAAAFDLVSVQYFPLRCQPDQTALRGLLDAVAPGGTLLFASHDPADIAPRPDEGFDPNDYYQPDDVAKFLDNNWSIQVNETRLRTAPTPAGTHHTHDTVLRAQRRR